MTLVRHATASAAVFSGGRVLMIFHNNEQRWQVPGGHVEPNELPWMAAQRELREETGLEADLWRGEFLELGGSLWHPSPVICERATPRVAGERVHLHYDSTYVFINPRGEQRPQAGEVSAVRWMPVDRLAAEPGMRPDQPALVGECWRRLHSTEYQADM